jgi:hypothetical protein
MAAAWNICTDFRIAECWSTAPRDQGSPISLRFIFDPLDGVIASEEPELNIFFRPSSNTVRGQLP